MDFNYRSVYSIDMPSLEELRKMVSEKKVSAMIIDVGGDLLRTVGSQEEMQAHLDLVSIAWNMAINLPTQRKKALKSFIKKQKKHAPSVEALKGLEWELRRIMKQKDILFPQIENKIAKAEAIEEGSDNYIIRAYFKEG